MSRIQLNQANLVTFTPLDQYYPMIEVDVGDENCLVVSRRITGEDVVLFGEPLEGKPIPARDLINTLTEAIARIDAWHAEQISVEAACDEERQMSEDDREEQKKKEGECYRVRRVGDRIETITGRALVATLLGDGTQVVISGSLASTLQIEVKSLLDALESRCF